MKKAQDPTEQASTPPEPKALAASGRRLPYEPPRLSKKRSVSRVTLFSGGSGFTTTG